MTAFSQLIGNWNFTGTLNGTAGTYNTVTPITLGSAIGSGSYHSSSEYYGEDGWPSGAVASNAYLQFRLAPLPGYHLNISTVRLRMRRSQTGIPLGSGPTRWALRSSLDNFTTDIATGTLTTAYQDFTVTPGSAFMALTGNISFRVYGYQQSTTLLGSNRLVLDDISVFGIGMALPVKLSSFTVAPHNADRLIKWIAGDIAPGVEFYVERSTNGTAFEEIFYINDRQGAATKEYQYIDANKLLASKVYYRIKVKEPTGEIHYSSIAMISNVKTVNDKIISVQASSSGVRAKLYVSDKGPYQCTILSNLGIPICKKYLALEQGENSITIASRFLIPGHYVVLIQSTTRKLTKAFVY